MLAQYSGPAMSVRRIEERADDARERLGVRDSVHLHMAWIIEGGLPLLVPGANYEVREAVEMGANLALTYPDERVIAFRDDTFIGLAEGKPLARMTAAHEIGHLSLHPSFALARVLPGTEVPTYCQVEWQAKCFGGAFMMPRHIVCRFDSISAVAAACGVTMDAATHRVNRQLKMGMAM